MNLTAYPTAFGGFLSALVQCMTPDAARTIVPLQMLAGQLTTNSPRT